MGRPKKFVESEESEKLSMWEPIPIQADKKVPKTITVDSSVK